MGILSKLFGPGTPKVMPTSLNDANFLAEVLQTKGVVMVDIWSIGCAPCKQLEPIILRLANEYAGRAKVAELCANRAPQTMAKLGVQGTPTVLYFVDGALVEEVVGFRGSLWHSQTLDMLLEGRSTKP